MLLDWLVADVLRAALLLGLALAAMPLLRRSTSATRRLVLALALGGALAVPAVSAVTPAWRIGAPAPMVALRGVVIPEPAVTGDAAGAATPAEPTAAPSSLPAPRVGMRRGVDATIAVLASVWGLGALLVLARLVLGFSRVRAMARRAMPSPVWSAAIARAEMAMGLHAAVLVTDELDAPAVTGVRTPIVLVPHASESWSDGRRHAVLLHELAHVRQRDCLVHVVAQLACAVHWFNPLAWMAVRRLRIERELAADDAVIVAGARASAYAEDLLAIAAMAGANEAVRKAPSFALGMAERSQLAARVIAIVSPERARRPLSRLRSRLLIAASAIAVTATACATWSNAGQPSEGRAGSNAGEPSPPPPPPGEGWGEGGSTIDPRMQAIADEELDHALAEWKAEAGTVLVLDPSTGEILANAGRAHGARADVAVRSAYVPGSTFKLVTMAGALDEGLVSPSDRIDCEHGAWTYQGDILRDSSSHGTLTVADLFAVSSNIGVAKLSVRLGPDRFTRWLHAFHFGSAPGIEGANAGQMPAHVGTSYDDAVLALGGAGTTSPLQIAAAYAAVANVGAYVAPTQSRRSGSPPREQIMKPETARAIAGMLDGVVNSEQGTGKLARIPGGPRVAGKTGTAGWELPNGAEGFYASFVGFAPASTPRVVILVGVEQPRDRGTGPKVAAPVFARVASRVLGG